MSKRREIFIKQIQLGISFSDNRLLLFVKKDAKSSIYLILLSYLILISDFLRDFTFLQLLEFTFDRKVIFSFISFSFPFFFSKIYTNFLLLNIFLLSNFFFSISSLKFCFLLLTFLKHFSITF